MSLLAPQGFRSCTANMGLKDDADDFAAVVSEVPAVSAAVFTRSRFAGPSVTLSRASAAAQDFRGMVVISRNANVATGATGEADAAEVRRLVAEKAGIAPEQLVIGSTGVIGRPYPMDGIRAGIAKLSWPFDPADYDAAATAIMTTDTRPKVVRLRCGDAVLVGIAKGVGMIEPNMATLLTFFFTDADVPAPELDALFRRVMDRTFNALSIDTDTSTSDTAAVFANGLAGPVDPARFEEVLYQGALTLVRDIASDGEGATKLIEVRVTGARDAAQAKRVAKVVVNSPLVKTSVHGADPNWGRVAMAIGKLDDDPSIDPAKVTIAYGDLPMYPQEPDDAALEAARGYLSGSEVVIRVGLGIGDAGFTVYGCDLTPGYVDLNSGYTT
ncbi:MULTISPECIES: bifunctional glutamate N-acetyltransferase/amino-acid acetyltransferase ArgJ [Streptomycetaceae]|uniref:Arginine biosynthesis bifunctional protein ArgJ n=1 Tax=Streptantibioticus cattleyicolor (strain ATCC 35852 / DSM 46488 / JCM 4925 / NBRC 14057 / NRRL 8057) TaxID=1003195 RepID=F8JRT3_STREN|nr:MULTISPECIES: bifunctional glutamate N-acetyltransferase/amino-acid acetyltransferase ArgJ [Streptomycetaceae]AEW97386.1 bifunctional ornithine acetyltransferase/N-acetylglutamate synthase protein [Streptantibioticus cattleyicolor NRRL 8057 = DSM 46488]MYS61832.1 bifunctional glutamate N-acetyltransferase/amino-acid acetyltransferase ArgJ [Streptomyces sp. SID5468]CCB77710.1 Glutamate N-acetyltransferase 2 [Streptantibioticus cattleyicolor NRRL 8057 = DSM 46488]